VPFAELLPVILSYSGRDLAEAGLEHDGWVLQRLDETAINESMTPAQVSLTHGDVLYLRPAMRQLPELSAGEAGAADGAEPGPPDWPYTVAVSVAGGAPAGVLAILLLGGFPWVVPVIVAGVLAIVLCGLGAVASRFERTSGLGVACRLGALPLAFLSGLHPAGLADVGLGHVLPGLGALALAALIGSAGRMVPVFAAVAGVALAGTAATGTALIFPDLSVAAAAALVTTAVLTVDRGARLIVQRIRAGVPHALYLEPDEPRSALAATWSDWKEGLLTGLTLSIGVTGALTAGILSFSGDRLGWATSAALSSILLVRSRDARSDITRVALVLSGTTGLALLPIGVSHTTSPGLAAVALAALLAGAAVLVAVCLRLRGRPPRQPSPAGIRRPPSSWSRVLGLAEVVLTLGAVLLSGLLTGR
jgi:hypothetical protein